MYLNFDMMLIEFQIHVLQLLLLHVLKFDSIKQNYHYLKTNINHLYFLLDNFEEKFHIEIEMFDQL